MSTYEHTITYPMHSDGIRRAWPAANVKVDLFEPDADALADHGITDPDHFHSWLQALPGHVRHELDMAAHQAAGEVWWFETMPELVREHINDRAFPDDYHFDPANIWQEGRSGGWLVLHEENDDWSIERHAAWAELSEILTESARTEGRHEYWWTLGLMAVDNHHYLTDFAGEASTYEVTLTYFIEATSPDNAVGQVTSGGKFPDPVIHVS